MTQDEIAAKLAQLAKDREQLLANFNFQLGVLAGQEAVLKEILEENSKKDIKK
jgi:hypothetical protein